MIGEQEVIKIKEESWALLLITIGIVSFSYLFLFVKLLWEIWHEQNLIKSRNYVNKKAKTIKKMEIPQYITEIRRQKMTFDRAVERILTENNIVSAPVPVIRIAQNLGFAVYASSFKDKNVAGVMADSALPVKPFHNRRIIVVNQEDPATRQNFTIAHEIAYFVLHCSNNNDFYERYRHGLDQGQKPEIERTANAFAAKLLMPENMVRAFLATASVAMTRKDQISAIVTKFIAPKKAVEKRFAELGI